MSPGQFFVFTVVVGIGAAGGPFLAALLLKGFIERQTDVLEWHRKYAEAHDHFLSTMAQVQRDTVSEIKAIREGR